MRAPRRASSVTIVRLGATRMSSVLGLKAKPHRAIVLPLRSSPKRCTILSTSTSFCCSLTASTAANSWSGQPASAAVLARALTSFGKHDPP